MVKKLLTILILWASFFMPIFGISVTLPGDGAYNKSTSDIYIKQWETTISNESSKQAWESLYRIVNFVNSYLWWSFAVVCTGAVVFWGYCLITSNGDKKALKQGIWALIWSAIWVVVAMLSYAIVNLLANLNP